MPLLQVQLTEYLFINGSAVDLELIVVEMPRYSTSSSKDKVSSSCNLFNVPVLSPAGSIIIIIGGQCLTTRLWPLLFCLTPSNHDKTIYLQGIHCLFIDLLFKLDRFFSCPRVSGSSLETLKVVTQTDIFLSYFKVMFDSIYLYSNLYFTVFNLSHTTF